LKKKNEEISNSALNEPSSECRDFWWASLRTEYVTGITKTELSLKLNQDDVKDAGFMKVNTIVTEVVRA
jgi:hypothetical protein